MKKYTFLLLILFALSAVGCQNIGDIFENDNDCPVLTKADVPQAVVDAFESRYSKGEIVPDVLLWCDAKKKTYKILFMEDLDTKVVSFDETGKFLTESVENESEGDDDHEDKDKGCECEIDDDDDMGGDDDD